MDFSERKQQILQAIIRDYIDTAEPVGSRTISKKYDLNLSSATIRNEMADLEEMGLITQPHTSAGRIPSHLGYRIYVDKLMKKDRLTPAEISVVKRALELRMGELDTLITQVADTISQLTRYTSVVISPEMISQKIKHTELIYIDPRTLVLVMVVGASTVKNRKLRLDYEVDESFVHGLSDLLNEMLAEVDTRDVGENIKQQILLRMRGSERIVCAIFDIVLDTLRNLEKSDVYLSGSTNLLNYPEYSDVSKAREFLNFLDDKNQLLDVVRESSKDNAINITIGRENRLDEMQDSSMIVSTYSVGNKIYGKIGIIGPTRMDYSKIVSSLETVTKSLNEVLYRYFYGDHLE